ncbi:uncharacterized protein AtWU_07745 [Aspergillus tubingensis]|uniref:Phosphotransferase enzyme family protein n=1 Tax=Aspergillus niger TaxID=5061 RepID=A0A117DYG5_ASPNG|nr:phosphotransferase enzyme family protein [Aspergillus tubingensis]GAQ39457.1 phosphotransferase enzyme family protein [Aspergillus niger]GFN17943.1 phosphotransferase enzyme family protein [Aspergillus tubingensis]
MSTAKEKQNVQSVGSGPQVNIHYSAPGFAVLDPDTIKTMANPSNTIFSWGGVQIVKISPEVAVKFGSHVTLHEAENRDVDDYGSLYDNYIFMSYVEGQRLDKAWDTYNSVTKGRIAGQLKGYLDGLRQVEHRNYIGSVDRGPLRDSILGDLEYKGPFDSEDDFMQLSMRIKTRHQNVMSRMSCYLKNCNETNGQKLHAIVPSHCDHLPIGPSESISKRPARIAPVAPPLLLPPVPSRALTQPLLGATSSFLSANDSPELLPVAVMSLAARLPGLSTQPICFLQSFARSPVVV